MIIYIRNPTGYSQNLALGSEFNKVIDMKSNITTKFFILQTQKLRLRKVPRSI